MKLADSMVLNHGHWPLLRAELNGGSRSPGSSEGGNAPTQPLRNTLFQDDIPKVQSTKLLPRGLMETYTVYY